MRHPVSLNLKTADGSRSVQFNLDPDQMSQRFMLEAFGQGQLYEAETSYFLGNILAPGDTFIDIGAHVGYFSMLGSALVGPYGRVFSFEPEASNWNHLLEHIELNGVRNVLPNFMAVGAALGAAGVVLPQVEGMVAFSVLALGCAVGSSVRLAWYWAVPLVAAFALFHGHAHGTEMPEFSSPWQYFAGFALATVALHALGVTAGVSLKSRPSILRAGGAAIGLAGGWLVVTL